MVVRLKEVAISCWRVKTLAIVQLGKSKKEQGGKKQGFSSDCHFELLQNIG